MITGKVQAEGLPGTPLKHPDHGLGEDHMGTPSGEGFAYGDHQPDPTEGALFEATDKLTLGVCCP